MPDSPLSVDADLPILKERRHRSRLLACKKHLERARRALSIEDFTRRPALIMEIDEALDCFTEIEKEPWP
jgi:hypothetical protein